MTGAFFPKDIYIERRKQLSKTVGAGLVLLMGNEESSMNYKDNWYRFRQDSSFLYYAGLDVPGLCLLLDLDNSKEYLVGENASIDDIIWTGPLPTLEEMAGSVGLHHSIDYKGFQSILQTALSKKQKIHILPPYRPENRIKLAGWLSVDLSAVDQWVSIDLIKSIVSQREIKQETELDEMEKAVTVSADMHEAVIRNAKVGMKEYELVAFTESIANAHWGRLAYSTILTINGQTLHNHYYGNTIQEGHMVLVDAGAEIDSHYVAI
jgi:Xaa-Pro aminopeptidase